MGIGRQDRWIPAMRRRLGAVRLRRMGGATGRPSATDNGQFYSIRNPPFAIRNASLASGGLLDADLRSATTDRGPQTAAAFGRDDGP